MNTRFSHVRVLVYLLLDFAFYSTAIAAMRCKIIIDQNAFGPGGPDLHPILMILQSPESGQCRALMEPLAAITRFVRKSEKYF